MTFWSVPVADHSHRHRQFQPYEDLCRYQVAGLVPMKSHQIKLDKHLTGSQSDTSVLCSEDRALFRMTEGAILHQTGPKTWPPRASQGESERFDTSINTLVRLCCCSMTLAVSPLLVSRPLDSKLSWRRSRGAGMIIHGTRPTHFLQKRQIYLSPFWLRKCNWTAASSFM